MAAGRPGIRIELKLGDRIRVFSSWSLNSIVHIERIPVMTCSFLFVELLPGRQFYPGQHG